MALPMFLILLALLIIVSEVEPMREQAVGVRGVLKCGNRPASEVHVKVETKCI